MHRLRSLLVLAVILLLSGCLETESDIEITKDGMQKYKIVTTVENNINFDLNEMTKNFEEDGYLVGVESEKGDNRIIATKETNPGGWFIYYPEALVRNKAIIFEQSYSNYFLFRTYTFYCLFQLDKSIVENRMQEVPAGLVIPFSYHIRLPGKITKTNAQEVTNGEMIWRYTIAPGRLINIDCKSIYIDWINVCISVAAFIAIAISFAVILKKRRR